MEKFTPFKLTGKCLLLPALVICWQLVFSTVFPARAEVRIHKKPELIRLLSQLEWGAQGPYSSKSIPITPDIVITNPIRVSPNEIPIPAACQKRTDCRHSVSLGYSRPVPGIHCEGSEKYLGRQSCREIALSPGKYRFRGIMIDTHPSRYNFIPFLEVYSSSKEACEQGEFTCTGNNTCYSSFNEYCRLCLGLAADECACRDENGIMPDGSKCRFFVSGDVKMGGVCRQGICITERKGPQR